MAALELYHSVARVPGRGAMCCGVRLALDRLQVLASDPKLSEPEAQRLQLVKDAVVFPNPRFVEESVFGQILPKRGQSSEDTNDRIGDLSHCWFSRSPLFNFGR